MTQAYILPTLAPSNALSMSWDKAGRSFQKKASVAGWSAGAATFLVLGALIVIACASLCLTLPGVNVLNDLVWKAYLPASASILLSLPLIVKAVLTGREKNAIRAGQVTEMTDFIIAQWDQIKILSKEDQIEFFLYYFLQWKSRDPNSRMPKKTKYSEWWLPNTQYAKDFQRALLGQIKQAIEKRVDEPHPKEVKDFLSSLEEARGIIFSIGRKGN